jgi:hypothetical protein
MGPTALLPPWRKGRCGFLSLLKIHRSRPVLSPRIVNPIASTLTMKPSRVTQLTLHQVGEIEKIQQQGQSTTNKRKVNIYFKVETHNERQWLFRFRSFRLLRRVHLQPWRWRRYVRPKLSYLPTTSNGVINEKTNTDKCPFITGW